MRVDIVGAGPAGLAVALGLTHRDTQNRFDIHLWDRNDPVRTTPCGEGLHIDRLSMLDGFDSTPFIGARLRGACVDAPGARRLTVLMPCATMARSRWIPAMVDEVARRGVRLHLGAFLSEGDIKWLPGDVVVGADGPSSRVARIVGNSRRFTAATQIRYEDTPALDDLLVFRWDRAYSQDYSWVFPRGDHTSVGVLAPASQATFIAIGRLASAYGVGGSELLRESYPIPYGGDRVVAGRYALVGDAAGVANPLTKGGMGPAFIQARMLCEALLDGGLEAYARSVAASPVSSDLPVRGLDVLHRLAEAEVRRVAGQGPGEVTLGSRATLAAMLRTLFGGTPAPRLWRDALLLIRALRHAVRWGW